MGTMRSGRWARAKPPVAAESRNSGPSTHSDLGVKTFAMVSPPSMKAYEGERL